MQIILLERYKKLGDVGDIVNVRNGFARNFLIPNKKAIQATDENKEIFKQKEKIIHQEVNQKQAHAEQVSSKLKDKWVYILKQAGKDGKLYGSVSSVDIVQAINEQLKQELHRSNIQLITPIKYIGCHEVSINVFADIDVKVNVIVSRTKDEAEVELKNSKEEKLKSNLGKSEKTKKVEKQGTKLEDKKSHIEDTKSQVTDEQPQQEESDVKDSSNNNSQKK